MWISDPASRLPAHKTTKSTAVNRIALPFGISTIQIISISTRSTFAGKSPRAVAAANHSSFLADRWSAPRASRIVFFWPACSRDFFATSSLAWTFRARFVPRCAVGGKPSPSPLCGRNGDGPQRPTGLASAWLSLRRTTRSRSAVPADTIYLNWMRAAPRLPSPASRRYIYYRKFVARPPPAQQFLLGSPSSSSSQPPRRTGPNRHKYYSNPRMTSRPAWLPWPSSYQFIPEVRCRSCGRSISPIRQEALWSGRSRRTTWGDWTTVVYRCRKSGSAREGLTGSGRRSAEL